MRRGEIDALICWHTDRLYRSLKDLVRLFEVAGNIEIRTVNGGDLDLSTATGKMLATILGSVAVNESEHKAERQRRAARQKAEQGRPQWRRAFGYVEDTYGVDPTVAPLVKEGYAAIVAGASLKDVADIFNAAGKHGLNGKPWSRSTVSLFLRAPRNAGLRAHRGEIVGKGTWPPLVDEDMWRAAQFVLNADARKPGPKSVRQHLLTGMMRCGKQGCDGYLSGQWVMQANKGAPKSHVITYACKTCRGCSIRAEHVEPMIKRALIKRLARPDAVELRRKREQDSPELEALQAEGLTLADRLDEIADERADGLLTGPQAQRATARINDRLQAIERLREDENMVEALADLENLGTPEVAGDVERVLSKSQDRYRTILNLIMEVTVQPVGKGGHVFKKERVAEGIRYKL